MHSTQSIIPTPSLTPHELLLLHQIQQHAVSNSQAALLSILMSLPLPLSLRIDLYYAIGDLPLSHLSPLSATLIIIFWPLGLLLFLILGYFLLRWLIRSVVPIVLSLFVGIEDEKAYLSLTFPSDTQKSAYATEQVYKLLHTLARAHTGFLRPSPVYAFEINATQTEGIRYIIGVPKQDVQSIHHSLLSYLPGLEVTELSDYLNTDAPINISHTQSLCDVFEVTLSTDGVLPLHTQKVLSEHDPMAFLTTHMTQLTTGEQLVFQLLMSPQLTNQTESHVQLLRNVIAQGRPVSPYIQKKSLLPQFPSIFLFVFSPLIWSVLTFFRVLVHIPYLLLAPRSPQATGFFAPADATIGINPYEQELALLIKEKLSQPLFATTIRFFVRTQDSDEFVARTTGLLTSFGQYTSAYQSLSLKRPPSLPLLAQYAKKQRLQHFFKRTPMRSPMLLSTAEVSDLYHFPNMEQTPIAGMVTHKSGQLPPPLSLTNPTRPLDVIVGHNSYGGRQTLIGLAPTDRHQHTYILGKTGMGKSTILAGMALQDISSGKGICVIDPHGDLVEQLLTLIPPHRQKDVIYINPADKDNPVGLNILSPGIHFKDREEEQDWIAGAVMEVFMKITPEKNWGQRMEHILRNAILTILQTPTKTADMPYHSLYAIQKLLTDEGYRKRITEKITDPILSQFWKKEFNLYRKNQQAEMVSPLTNKLGEFMTNHMSRNILLQEKSTVNVSNIMDNSKILLVNLSKGRLREERSAFFGVLITELIQLAIHERAQYPQQQRNDFFVYIDEFQNFATPQFTQLFSEARKYHVFFIPTHQNIAQIDDIKVAKIMQGNAGTLIALRGSPDDEKVMLPYLTPEVEKGQIVNLPPHHFFMKVTNDANENAFSGVTIPIQQEGSQTVAQHIIAHSRTHYATPRKKVEEQLEQLFKTKPIMQTTHRNKDRTRGGIVNKNDYTL